MLFPNPLPETIFRGSKCQPMLKSAILDRFPNFLGVPKPTLGATFSAKRRQSGTPELCRTRPGSDLVAIWRRKRSKDTFVSIWDRFLIDFGRILGKCSNDYPHVLEMIVDRCQVDFRKNVVRFRMDIRRLFKDFCKNSDIDVPTCLVYIHTMWPGGVRASRLNNWSWTMFFERYSSPYDMDH